ncbi:hypothetical protein [Bacillus sp. V5-8f]|uniref:hypothetical protein n=1 Tax=Bacillus sp. V5-8f TaxID=2053044 RepID=UPI000C76C8F1|nr:hypothetical protein [Bacillus sp. V5-8f]PLT35528.1 hypothetical protein CUU64_02665 [Bacillus sp. V5-8f]
MNWKVFSAVSTILVNGVVLLSLLFSVFILHGYSGQDTIKHTQVIPNGYLSTVFNSEQIPQANYQWKSESNQLLSENIPDVQEYARKNPEQTLKRGAKVRFYIKDKGHELNGKQVLLFLSQNGKKMQVENLQGTFHAPDKAGNYLFEANFKAEQGTIQYISMLRVR